MLLAVTPALAIDIFDTLPAATDQPRIYAYVAFGDRDPQMSIDDFTGLATFTFEAFLDTGASGNLIAREFAYDSGGFGIQRQTFNGQNIVFRDVGVDGTSDYYVSGPQSFDGSGPLPMRIGLASYNPATFEQLDNLETYQQVYNQVFTNIRSQLTIQPVDEESGRVPFNVLGMPVMQGKVVVMDPYPATSGLARMNTYVYDPGTPFREETLATDPGIPQTTHQVKLSYADASRFTQTVTEDDGQPISPALGATLADNPFVGPNPFRHLDPNPPPDNTPGVKIAYNGISLETSLLLDTGAGASAISTRIAEQLGITVDRSDPSAPVLVGTPESNQFQVSVVGAGGTAVRVPGFFLDSMLLRTIQGNAANDADPNHFNYVGAPVLVFDIALEDPVTHQQVVLDGLLGMNALMPTAYPTDEGIPAALERGNFKWITFDQPNGLLGLEYKQKHNADIIWIGSLFDEQVWNGEGHWYIGIPIDIPGLGEIVDYEDGQIVAFEDLLFSAEAPNVRLDETVFPGGVIYDNDYDVDYRLYGTGKISGDAFFRKRGYRTTRIETSNDYTGLTTVEDGVLIFAVPQDIGDVEVQGKGTLVAESRQTFKRLHVRAGGRMSVLGNAAGNNIIDVTDVAVEAGGTVELADNGMIVRPGATNLAATLLEVNDLLRRGRNGGTWDGDGITSTVARDARRYLTTLAVILNDDNTGVPFHTTFFGLPVDLNSILVHYSWTGDLNLDGLVNQVDYGIINTNFALFQQDPTLELIYGDGDLDYDGDIDADDFWLIDHAYMRQTGGFPVAPPAPSPVPEPTTAGAIAILGAMSLTRRRRRPQRLTSDL